MTCWRRGTPYTSIRATPQQSMVQSGSLRHAKRRKHFTTEGLKQGRCTPGFPQARRRDQ
jgi:hypothetical protein